MNTIEPIIAATFVLVFFGTVIVVCASPALHMAFEVYDAYKDITK